MDFQPARTTNNENIGLNTQKIRKTQVFKASIVEKYFQNQLKLSDSNNIKK